MFTAFDSTNLSCFSPLKRYSFTPCFLHLFYKPIFSATESTNFLFYLSTASSEYPTSLAIFTMSYFRGKSISSQ